MTRATDMTKEVHPGHGEGQGRREALAVDAARLARLLGISLSHVRRLDAAGQLPRPLKIGRCVRWPVRTIEQWLAAGTPNREAWEKLHQSRGITC